MDNKSILKTANIAITNGDYEVFLSHCTDDTIWNFIGDKTLHGKESVRKYIEDTYLEPPKFEVENLIAEDDFVTAIGKISLKENGQYKSYLYCDIWRFRDGKMAELKAFVI
ncbi:ketosteroid isomerase [Flavobacterium sp. Root935]|uniref:nuclear transport factor 2 family protein n=1 Tax=Flavobacterium sp. Root935 TaxID=1736610 RepID=UPI00070E86FF|nr:nuclear transport factor 2 family protein [Flavobacterium sp. Root935]KRD58743.1 ketosteroid isomerase [Flavobacterium sp. Root935]